MARRKAEEAVLQAQMLRQQHVDEEARRGAGRGPAWLIGVRVVCAPLRRGGGGGAPPRPAGEGLGGVGSVAPGGAGAGAPLPG